MPGETFSYNQVVGKRTIDAGYKEAGAYAGGKVIQEIGGGICQVSSTLYNAVLYADLEIVERSNHYFETSYVTAGRDATVSWGTVDFKFKNNRTYPIKIEAVAKNGINKISILGIKEEKEYEIVIQSKVTSIIEQEIKYENDYSIPYGEEEVEQQGHNGCTSKTYIIKKLNGATVSTEEITSDYYHALDKIIKKSNNINIAILKGIDIRIEADAQIEDLKLVSKNEKQNLDIEFKKRIRNSTSKNNCDERLNGIIKTGKILHLDGDKKYAGKSEMYYKKMGLNAIVKNIPENKQSKMVKQLLMIYNPDILVITGHDGMIKNNVVNDIFNYRNSRHFIETIKQARKFEKVSKKKLVIFAGACQSYFEALISAGANFASSPARILIDFLDPLIVAKNVAETDNMKYVTIDDFASELRDGKNGVDGIGARGKKSIIII